jgi:hypothetical protein
MSLLRPALTGCARKNAPAAAKMSKSLAEDFIKPQISTLDARFANTVIYI